MKDEICVAGLGGSLAPFSRSLAALRIALRGAEEAGAAIRLFDIRALALPFYDPTSEVVPHAAAGLLDGMHAAHGHLWSSPLYHGTVSGAFKNALDWLDLLADREPPYLTGKVIGLISVAGGTHGLQAVNTMEFAARALRGWSVPLVLPIPAAYRTFDEQGRTTDPGIEERLRELGREVVRAARQFAGSGTCDYAKQDS